MHINFEFKARAKDLHLLEKLLQQQGAVCKGTDHQVDTYFNVFSGRLKLREGNIENALIHYERNDVKGHKQSEVTLYQHEPEAALKQALTKALGVKAVVDKKRKIYFKDNVKFHFDEVNDLGSFVEVEAIDKDGSIGVEKLRQQCNVYAQLFSISADDYLPGSYSDMLMAKKSSTK